MYVDEMIIVGTEPQLFFNNLIKDHGFKLTGIGKSTYYDSRDFVWILTLPLNGEPNHTLLR
jgi:hypothetical protein